MESILYVGMDVKTRGRFFCKDKGRFFCPVKFVKAMIQADGLALSNYEL